MEKVSFVMAQGDEGYTFWPTQEEITARRTALSALVFGLFNVANAAGHGDVPSTVVGWS